MVSYVLASLCILKIFKLFSKLESKPLNEFFLSISQKRCQSKNREDMRTKDASTIGGTDGLQYDVLRQSNELLDSAVRYADMGEVHDCLWDAISPARRNTTAVSLYC